MQKKIIALILLLSCFASKELISKSDPELPSMQFLAKGHPGYKILKAPGTLFFTFTTASSLGASVPKGKWRASIITPDKKTYKGPIIDVTSAPTTFEIEVTHPILCGTYRIVVENISVTSFLGSLTTAFVKVTNSFNSEVVDSNITPQINGSFLNAPNYPGLILEGEFTPFHPFIPH